MTSCFKTWKFEITFKLRKKTPQHKPTEVINHSFVQIELTIPSHANLSINVQLETRKKNKSFPISQSWRLFSWQISQMWCRDFKHWEKKSYSMVSESNKQKWKYIVITIASYIFKNHQFHNIIKHIDIMYRFIREEIEKTKTYLTYTCWNTKWAQRIILNPTGWTLRDRQEWSWLGQKWRIAHTNSDTERAQRILLDLIGWALKARQVWF